ncbi:MAG: hypothetical protein OEV37_00895 [Candidatus Berkelbacteria bacterium]|nr:hypothetical protein [Candidatus Berkelbacteria bacterium]
MLLAQAEGALEGAVDAAPEATISIDWGQLEGAAEAAGLGLGVLAGGFIIFWIIAGIIGLAFLIWWIVLMVDLVNRDFPQRGTYLILMILSFFLGFIWLMDLIYYFGVVKKGIGTKKASAPAETEAPAQTQEKTEPKKE